MTNGSRYKSTRFGLIGPNGTLGIGGFDVSFMVDDPFKLPTHYWPMFISTAAVNALKDAGLA